MQSKKLVCKKLAQKQHAQGMKPLKRYQIKYLYKRVIHLVVVVVHHIIIIIITQKLNSRTLGYLMFLKLITNNFLYIRLGCENFSPYSGFSHFIFKCMCYNLNYILEEISKSHYMRFLFEKAFDFDQINQNKMKYHNNYFFIKILFRLSIQNMLIQ